MKNLLKENWFKIIAIGILVGALWNHPYGYYQLLRWIVMTAGAYSAYLAEDNDNKTWFWIFAAITILFNPIIPFTFAKETWQLFDLIGAVIFIVSFFIKKLPEKTP